MGSRLSAAAHAARFSRRHRAACRSPGARSLRAVWCVGGWTVCRGLRLPPARSPARGAAIVAGPAPSIVRERLVDVNRDYRNAYRLAAWPEWALHPLLTLHDRSVRKRPDRALQAVLAQASPDDRATLANPQIAAQIQGYRAEASRAGARLGAGSTDPGRALGLPPGRRQKELHLWYWDGDSIVPPQMGRYLQAQLPRTVPHFLPGGGHFSLFRCWADILRSLLAS